MHRQTMCRLQRSAVDSYALRLSFRPVHVVHIKPPSVLWSKGRNGGNYNASVLHRDQKEARQHLSLPNLPNKKVSSRMARGPEG
jgi:hypothetical protein